MHPTRPHADALTVSAEARLICRGTRLIPVQPEHAAFLRRVELESVAAFRWRHAGVHAPPDEFLSSLFSDVLCSFLVTRASDQPPMGMVAAYGADLRNGHCRVGASRFGPTPVGFQPELVRAVFMVFDYLFQGWPLRKIYLEVPEYNMTQIGSSIGRLFDAEAQLKEYVYLDGKYWDQFLLSLTRERWDQVRPRYERFAPRS